MTASERILALMEQQNISAYRVSKDASISQGCFSTWKNNPTSNIGGEIIIKLADYLGVSCSYLLLGTERNESKTQMEALALLPYKDIIDAYKKANKKTREIVRVTLDLPPEK